MSQKADVGAAVASFAFEVAGCFSDNVRSTTVRRLSSGVGGLG